MTIAYLDKYPILKVWLSDMSGRARPRRFWA
jgi:hypothetical protein